MRKNLEDARQQLLTKDTRFVEMMRHGSMTVEWYAPAKVDLQQPHTQDELYVVMSGSGKFQNGIETYSFGPGDVLFVAAGVEHRFFDFTDDFGTWVIFYGPQGGEKGEQ
jgi:mannose-6-phosphate isomerase-like protein (cupin superfamily)